MASINAHDDLQPSPSALMRITTKDGYEMLMEIRSEWNIATMRIGELRIGEQGVRMIFEYGSPVKEIF